MIQFKTKFEGQSASGPGGDFWVSPQRDIAYIAPTLIHKALYLMENLSDPVMRAYYKKGGTNQKLGDLAKAYARFCQIATDPTDASNVRQAAEKAGLHQIDADSLSVFGYALGNVMISCYFSGIREAQNNEFRPFIFTSPEDIMRAAPRSIWRKIWDSLVSIWG